MHKGQLVYKGLVYPWNCDHMGHMNVMWYVGKFDEATWAFLGSLGLIGDYLNDNNRGMAVLEQKLAYKREALPGDLLEIYASPLEVTAKAIRIDLRMFDVASGALCATCDLLAVHLDKTARRAIAFPDDIRTTAQALL